MTTIARHATRWVCGLFFLTLFIHALPAQPTNDGFADNTQLPAGIPGERVTALLQAVNSNDPEHIKQFIDRHIGEEFRKFAPIDEMIHALQGTYKQTGGLDFYSIRTYTPPREGMTVIAKDRLFGGWHGFSFRLEGSEQRIERLNFNPARPPAAAKAAEKPLSENDFLQTLSGKIDELCQKDVFSGTVLIAKGDKILLEKACGEATKSWHIANNIDTKFNLGSMNKMFTATAVMQLAEKGKLQLDDPISKYVDESWLPKTITDRVTVHHLLSHTSGLGSYFNDTYMKSSRDLFRQVDDYKSLVQGDTLSFEPGKRFQYSNTGMLLLGVVIEKASEMNYFDYIRQHIYEPAGMKNSDCYELDRPQVNLAEGYIPEGEGGWKNNLFMHVLKGGPAGGGYSTVRDLHRFARALQNGKLVSQASLDKMWQDQSGVGYGYGFETENTPAGKRVGHGGGFPGLNSGLDINTGSGYIVAVMSNYDMGAEALKAYIRRLIDNRLQP